MTLDVGAVQKALHEQGLDGWLWYDFQGANPIAQRMAGLGGGGHLASRRWFYLIPARGEPRGLVHAIERHNLDRLPGSKTQYAGRADLESGLKTLLSGTQRIAMEYSPKGAIPYVSRVDAGTIELVRAQGVEVVSSGDLIQQFEAHWSAEAIQSHYQAAEKLYRVKDRAFEAAAARIRDRVPTTEYDLQQLMWTWFAEEGLISDSAPNVSAQENAGNPHYLPSERHSRPIGRDELLLLDLWGKLDTPGAVFADITWIGFTGAKVPDEMGKAFAVVRDARDTAVQVVEDAARARLSKQPGTASTSCIEPGTASARPSTATARISTTTKRTTSVACCRAPASRSSRAFTSIALACGRRSTWSGAAPDPR
jgi:Xaa-Pro dipeptidase